jgi:hypothetical protein
MKIEQKLEVACRRIGAFWDKGNEGRYLIWKGDKFAELFVHPVRGGGYEFDLFTPTGLYSSDDWREIRKQIIVYFCP